MHHAENGSAEMLDGFDELLVLGGLLAGGFVSVELVPVDLPLAIGRRRAKLLDHLLKSIHHGGPRHTCDRLIRPLAPLFWATSSYTHPAEQFGP